MKKVPRDMSGSELVQLLCKEWDYAVAHRTKGSHVILATNTPSRHRVAVPLHTPLKIGTLHTILRQVAEHKGTFREAILGEAF